MKAIRGLFHAIAIIALLFHIRSFASDISISTLATANNGEQLVEKNVSTSAPVWCGDDHLVVDTDVAADETYPNIIDLSNKTNKKILSPKNLAATSCSPDGKWLLLIKIDASDKEFWRFNLETEQKELFAIGYGGIWSPDGKKVLFTAKQKGGQKTIAQLDPQWVFYFAHEWPSGTGGSVTWLADSETLVLANKGKFYLQSNQEISPLQLLMTSNWDERIYVIDLKTSLQGDIYALVSVTEKLLHKTSGSRSRRLIKCSLDTQHKQIKCDELTTTDEEVAEFDISRDGHRLVYVDKNKSCLSKITPDAGKERCFIKNVSGNVSIAPDGKRITYSRDREEGKSHGHSFYARDLFLIQTK